MKLINRIFRGKGQPDDRSSVANPKLIAAIEAVVKNDGTDTRHRLYSALLDATLLVPTPELPDSWRAAGDHIADGKTGFKIVAVNKSDGKQTTPVFSDEVALRNWDPNTPWLGLKARDYFSLVVQFPIQEVVINPFDPIRKMIRSGGTITRWEMELLAKGELPTVHPAM